MAALRPFNLPISRSLERFSLLRKHSRTSVSPSTLASVNQLVYTFEGQTAKVPLSDKPVSFGRSDGADHRLPDKSASRIHAQFILREGRWCVEDLESANG